MSKRNEANEQAPTCVQRFDKSLETALRSAEKDTESRSYKENRWNKWSDWVPTLTLIAAVVYAALTYLLWEDTKRTADYAQEQAVVTNRTLKVTEDQEFKSLRAYLIMPVVDDQQHPPSHLLFNRDGAVEGWQAAKNVGQTPAYNIVNYIAMRSLPVPLPLMFSFPTQNRYSQPSLEQQTLTFWNIHSRDFNVIADRTELRSWKKGIYLYGTIFYDDVFGRHHWCNYCYYFLPDAWVTTYCDTHNDSDDSRSFHDTPPAQ